MPVWAYATVGGSHYRFVYRNYWPTILHKKKATVPNVDEDYEGYSVLQGLYGYQTFDAGLRSSSGHFHRMLAIGDRLD